MLPTILFLVIPSLFNIIDISSASGFDADILIESVDKTFHKNLEGELAKSDLSLKQLAYFEENSDAKFLEKVVKQKTKLKMKWKGPFTFDDLKQRIEFDLERKFMGSAWFGGTSPFHKFNSNCYYALGRAEGNDCVFTGNKPSKCTSNPHGDSCGESFLPGCWHGTAKAAKKKGEITNSLTCYPMARSSYMTNMLPPLKGVRLNSTQFVLSHIMKTVNLAFDDFKKSFTSHLQRENMKRLLLTAEEGKKLLDNPHFIDEIMNPKDAFWNIFMDLLPPPDRTAGNINLCAYFINASLNAAAPLGDGKNAADSLKNCLSKTKKLPIPPLCIQNFAASATDVPGKEAAENGKKLKEYIADKEDWKLIRFITSDTLISKFKGCLCFGDRCNDKGFELS